MIKELIIKRFDDQYGTFELCTSINAVDRDRLKLFIDWALDIQKEHIINSLETMPIAVVGNSEKTLDQAINVVKML